MSGPPPLAINVVAQTLDALGVISVLIVVSLGLGVILGLTGVINLAHAGFIAVGAYATYVVVESGGSFWLALAIGPIAGLLVGLVVERLLIRFLYNRPLDTLLVTWGLFLIIAQLLDLIFGPEPKSIESPLTGQVDILGVLYPSFGLFSIGAALAVSVIALTWLYRTEFGLQIRAIIQDREMASAIGIHAGRVNAITFAAGAGLAAFAGVLITGQANLTAHIGLPYLAPSFLVVLIGGLGSIPGLIAACFLIGGAQTIFTEAINPVVAQAAALVLAILIARFMPQTGGHLGGAH